MGIYGVNLRLVVQHLLTVLFILMAGYADELFDLKLKSAHDRRYDPASLTAGSIVEFIITSGILVSQVQQRVHTL